VRGLLGLGFGISPEDAEYPALARAFLETYQMLDHRNSGLFPQWQPWLTAVPAGKLGIVTNKPRYLTERLLRVLHLEEHFGVVICGDDFDEKKPHPRPLLEAAARLGCAPGDCCYFGDSERDMAAARSAGQKAILVNWGYFDEHDAPEDWPWDQRVQSGDQAHRCCLDWLGPVL
jgi:phosphoglycolate phosphatase